MSTDYPWSTAGGAREQEDPPCDMEVSLVVLRFKMNSVQDAASRQQQGAGKLRPGG